MWRALIWMIYAIYLRLDDQKTMKATTLNKPPKGWKTPYQLGNMTHVHYPSLSVAVQISLKVCLKLKFRIHSVSFIDSCYIMMRSCYFNDVVWRVNPWELCPLSRQSILLLWWWYNSRRSHRGLVRRQVCFFVYLKHVHQLVEHCQEI